MLVIRHAQMKVLEDRSLNDFIRRVKIRLEEEFQTQYTLYSESELNDIILECIERAKTYDIFTEEDVYCYISAGLVFGETFDENEKYRRLRKSLDDKAQREAYFRAMDAYLAALDACSQSHRL